MRGRVDNRETGKKFNSFGPNPTRGVGLLVAKEHSEPETGEGHQNQKAYQADLDREPSGAQKRFALIGTPWAFGARIADDAVTESTFNQQCNAFKQAPALLLDPSTSLAIPKSRGPIR